MKNSHKKIEKLVDTDLTNANDDTVLVSLARGMINIAGKLNEVIDKLNKVEDILHEDMTKPSILSREEYINDIWISGTPELNHVSNGSNKILVKE